MIRLGAVAALIGLHAASAWADETFVESRGLSRHAAKDLPAVVPMAEALTAAPMPLYHSPGIAAYQPVLAGLSPQSGVQAMFGYAGAGETLSSALRGQAVLEDGGMSGVVRRDQSQAYGDGGSGTVEAGYLRDAEYLEGHYRPASQTRLRVNAFRDAFTNMKLPNYGADAARLSQTGADAAVSVAQLSGMFDQARATLSWRSMDSDANTYTLRNPSQFRIRYLVDRQSWKGGGLLIRSRDGATSEIGGDLSHDRLTGTRYNQEYGFGTFSAAKFPDVQTVRGGLFANHRLEFAESKIEAGFRYDLVAARIGDLDARPNVPGLYAGIINVSPRQLYTRYYGPNRPSDPVVHLFSGRLRGEQRLGDGATGYLDLSHLMRAPDTFERFHATTGGSALGQIGNPGLDPERHHRAELGGWAGPDSFEGYGRQAPPGSWRLGLSAANDWVSDFVTADRARGQTGIFMADGAIVYRNVQANLSKLSADFQATLAEGLALRANVAGERGRNVSDSRPLYQVAPFEANLFVDIFGGGGEGEWNAGLHSRLVAPRRDVDASTATGSGMDTGGAAAFFAVFDVYGGVRVSPSASLVLGIDNLFDRLYREHVNYFPLQPTTTDVYAPGRTVFARAVLTL